MPTVFAIFFEDADVPNVVGVPVVANTFAVVPAGLPVFVYGLSQFFVGAPTFAGVLLVANVQ
jgi:hypothetical protein